MLRCQLRRAAALFCVATLACTGDRPPSRTDSGGVASEYTCLPAPPLLGVRLGDSVPALRAALGEPLASVRSADEVTYRYARADVHVVRGRVSRIVSTTSGGWPKGLAVGSTRLEVDQYTIAQRLLRMTTDDTIEILVCPEHRAFLYLAPFGGARRVRRVELVSGRG